MSRVAIRSSSASAMAHPLVLIGVQRGRHRKSGVWPYSMNTSADSCPAAHDAWSFLCHGVPAVERAGTHRRDAYSPTDSDPRDNPRASKLQFGVPGTG